VRDCHYRIKKWPLLSETTPGQKNVGHPALRDTLKSCLTPLHIKLGLIEISVKVIKKVKGLQNFPKINEAKMKEGIFIGPQIRQLFKDQDFSTKLHSTEEEPGRHLKASAATF